jgi:gluconate 2-dehydrogenase gamma chain
MQKKSTARPTPPAKKLALSRRAFLKGTGLAVAATGASSLLASCAPETAPAPSPAPTQVLTLNDKYLEVPPAPAVPPDPGRLQFLTPSEARCLDAAVARLLPGTPDDPGAREMGVVTFIDFMLASSDGYAEPTYTQPPFAQWYSGDQPPAADTADVIYVPETWKENFGWQAGAPPQQLYRAGLRALDQVAGGSFADLAEEAQDDLLEQLSQGSDAVAAPFDDAGIPDFSGKAFFSMLHTHTIQGVFGDPLYGGNRYLAGWQLVGYAGAHRAYTEADLLSEGDYSPQSLAKLPPFHAGQPVSDDVIIPLANGNIIQQNTTPSPDQLLQYCQLKK